MHLLATLFLMVVISPFLHQHITYSWLLAIVLVLVLLAAARTVAREKRLFLVVPKLMCVFLRASQEAQMSLLRT